ncbi:hypothetical protein ACFC96_39200 [Streptomyces sp. NPDC055955]|uniref:hypothetical protein n=1 Tax=Streptomyces sp. NPDC055955 TaxID=3345665 RepID=UPI0035DC8BE8
MTTLPTLSTSAAVGVAELAGELPLLVSLLLRPPQLPHPLSASAKTAAPTAT